MMGHHTSVQISVFEVPPICSSYTNSLFQTLYIRDHAYTIDLDGCDFKITALGSQIPWGSENSNRLIATPCSAPFLFTPSHIEVLLSLTCLYDSGKVRFLKQVLTRALHPGINSLIDFIHDYQSRPIFRPRVVSKIGDGDSGAGKNSRRRDALLATVSSREAISARVYFAEIAKIRETTHSLTHCRVCFNNRQVGIGPLCIN